MARTVPVTTYETPGTLLTAELWNNGPKTLNDFLSNRPGFVARGNTSQSIANNTWTAISFTLNLLDPDSGHNVVTVNSEFHCQVAGWYWVKGSVSINPSGTGNNASRMETAIAKNSVIVVGSAQFLDKGTNVLAAQQASALVQLAVGDYVELWFRQHTGITISTDLGFGIETGFNALWLHT